MFYKIYGDETKCFQFWQKPLDVNFRQQTQDSCFACCVARLLLLNWNSVDKRWGAVGWFQKLCCIYLIYICRLFSFRGYFQKISSISYRQLLSVIVILKRFETKFCMALLAFIIFCWIFGAWRYLLKIDNLYIPTLMHFFGTRGIPFV